MTARNTDLNRGYPAKAGTRDQITLSLTCGIGAAGAIADGFTDGDSGLSVTKEAGDGEYRLHFPKIGAIQIARSRFKAGFLQNAAPATVLAIVCTDVTTYASGYVTFKTVDPAGAVANPAVGTLLWFELVTTSSGVRQ